MPPNLVLRYSIIVGLKIYSFDSYQTGVAYFHHSSPRVDQWPRMPTDVDIPKNERDPKSQAVLARRTNQGYHLSWLKLPAPVKRIFDKFPLVTYERNELPQARTGPIHKHTLYVFTSVEDVKRGNPSYNPTCLKWQVRISSVTIPATKIAETLDIGIPSLLWHGLCHIAFKQSCLTYWGFTIPPTSVR